MIISHTDCAFGCTVDFLDVAARNGRAEMLKGSRMTVSFRRTTAGAATIAIVGASTVVFGGAPAAAAIGDGCGPDAERIAPDVCEQVFTAPATTIIPPAGALKLEALLVGAGGSSGGQTGMGYATAGGGGEVRIIDATAHRGVATAEITVAVPAADATTSTASGIALGSQPIEIARSGKPGGTQGSKPGESGSGYFGASVTDNSRYGYGAGGGAGSAAVSAVRGGAGLTPSSVAPAGSLFADDATCYGGGGAPVLPTDPAVAGSGPLLGEAGCGGGGAADTTGTAVTTPRANSGGGAAGRPTGTAPAYGADGIVVLRWQLASHAVTFNLSGQAATVPAQTVIEGDLAAEPAVPTAPGYVFRGWYRDAALTQRADFGVAVTEPTTYFAAWAQQLTVTFNNNGTGSAIAPQKVPAGDRVTEPAVASVPGYDFAGWFTDKALTQRADFSAPITRATTFYAKWERQLVLVTFELNGHGSPIADEPVAWGDRVASPPRPEASGFTFDGWYADEALTTAADFTQPVTQATTFYAKWTEKSVAPTERPTPEPDGTTPAPDGAAPSDQPTRDAAPTLPRTGAESPVGAIIAAVLALVMGAVMTVRTRTRRRSS